ncbi:nucleoside-diphosphate sugar epimerase [Microbacterium sp. CGR1]|uniref:NAD(P)-dependent oxidoreductase n=1 Tax=Microbacterium sp. CGR1 TaxID=1696072 RepID=UPI00069EA4F2|nr:NAD(P)-binding oxidoreductase [Microbacterium sp. CGR1]AKV86542.1 nucleoside-diphosphate sugar epimerase [Microbacterium sp. CGR1]
MKLLVLGATGPTGQHVLERALEHGDEVTVLVRRPDALDGLANRVTVVQGDATSTDDVTRAMDGQDAVVSALGRATSFRSEELFTHAASAVVAAMGKTGVRRLVWLSSFGVGATFASASGLQKLFYRTFLRAIYVDKAASEKTLRGAGLDLTIAYPTALTHGPAQDGYAVGDRLPMRGNPTISRADVAHFLHLAAHDPAWTGRDAVLTD